MNLKRGLFRLWVVLSVGFIVLVAAVRFEPITREFVGAPSKAEAATDRIISADDAATDANEAATEAEAAESGRTIGPAPIDKNALKDKRARLLAAQTHDAYQQAWTDLGKSAAVAFGVPLMVLLLGYGVLWAWAGLGWKSHDNQR